MAENSKRLKHDSVGENNMQATKRVKDPRKQRKRLYNAPAHIRHKLMAAPLSPQLTASKKTKSLPVRKGDTVRVVRGDHIGFEGKVNRVDLKNYRIFLEGLTREKVDGTNIFVSVHPSKVIIKNLKLDDKWRKVILERKKALEPKKETKEKKVKKQKKAVEKPAEEAVEAEEEKAVEKKAEVQEEPVKEAPKTVKKAVPKKPAATKKKAEPAVKEAKPKTAKKTPAKRKAASKTKGGA
jgi:large subunit ribosomal protein L24